VSAIAAIPFHTPKGSKGASRPEFATRPRASFVSSTTLFFPLVAASKPVNARIHQPNFF
jgi:hypothetical protein